MERCGYARTNEISKNEWRKSFKLQCRNVLLVNSKAFIFDMPWASLFGARYEHSVCVCVYNMASWQLTSCATFYVCLEPSPNLCNSGKSNVHPDMNSEVEMTQLWFADMSVGAQELVLREFIALNKCS